MKKTKKSHFLLGSLILVISGWGIYLYNFFKVYQEADYYTNPSASALVKLAYVFSYFGDTLVPYVVLGFLLLNVTSLLALVLYFFNREKSSFTSFVFWLTVGVFVLSSVSFLLTILWPLMLILISVTLIIAYVLLTLNNKTYAEDQEVFEDNEQVKEAGPFEQKSEAEAYFKEFSEYWAPIFEKKELTLVPKITCNDNQNYHINIHVVYKK